jgi:LmbE family N-acetylglucosaminyl deacetylase
MMERVLVISPHPDDESIGCGGTLRKYATGGATVKVVFLTSGEQGGHGVAPERMAPIREREAIAAARTLGISDIEFWREPDSRLRASQRLVDAMAAAMDAFRPDTVFIPYIKDHHADHRAAARLARRAARECANMVRLLMYEVWTPVDEVDVIVDISPYVKIKRRAIRAYRSQCSVLGFDDAMLGLARYRGELFDWPKAGKDGQTHAEVFKVLPL